MPLSRPKGPACTPVQDKHIKPKRAACIRQRNANHSFRRKINTVDSPNTRFTDHHQKRIAGDRWHLRRKFQAEQYHPAAYRSNCPNAHMRLRERPPAVSAPLSFRYRDENHHQHFDRLHPLISASCSIPFHRTIYIYNSAITREFDNGNVQTPTDSSLVPNQPLYPRRPAITQRRYRRRPDS